MAYAPMLDRVFLKNTSAPTLHIYTQLSVGKLDKWLWKVPTVHSVFGIQYSSLVSNAKICFLRQSKKFKFFALLTKLLYCMPNTEWTVGTFHNHLSSISHRKWSINMERGSGCVFQNTLSNLGA